MSKRSIVPPEERLAAVELSLEIGLDRAAEQTGRSKTSIWHWRQAALKEAQPECQWCGDDMVWAVERDGVKYHAPTRHEVRARYPWAKGLRPKRVLVLVPSFCNPTCRDEMAADVTLAG